ncbi:hypothetical protein JW930_06675 [Candidatus Woesearchaeota archaeon]|nr:hypothetical protein [Candidatus Woesearchaeota archaeon]
MTKNCTGEVNDKKHLRFIGRIFGQFFNRSIMGRQPKRSCREDRGS